MAAFAGLVPAGVVHGEERRAHLLKLAGRGDGAAHGLRVVLAAADEALTQRVENNESWGEGRHQRHQGVDSTRVQDVDGVLVGVEADGNVQREPEVGLPGVHAFAVEGPALGDHRDHGTALVHADAEKVPPTCHSETESDRERRLVGPGWAIDIRQTARRQHTVHEGIRHRA